MSHTSHCGLRGRHFSVRRIAFAALFTVLLAPPAMGGELSIIADTSDPGQPEALRDVIRRFEAANPDVTVDLTINGREDHKTAIRNFLKADPPDLTTWYAGARMQVFSDAGLFADLSELWEAENLSDAMSSSDGLVRGKDGKVYGVPYSYYQWGIYYRRDVMQKHGVAEPETWDDLVGACTKLRAAGVTPIAIGTKFLWTAAGWFDYLNLRINGRDYHLRLAAGEIPYTDSRLDAVFAHWRELVDGDCFLKNHASYDWVEGAAPLIEGSAAMMLIGNFVMGNFAEAGVADKIEYAQFPVIKPGMPLYEDAPLDTWHIPSTAKNKRDAMRFLAFAASAEINALIPAAAGTLPPNKYAPPPEDRILQEGQKVLGAAAGLAQFYDRDTDPQMAKSGMEGFQEFMIKPQRLDRIRTRLENTRKRIYKK